MGKPEKILEIDTIQWLMLRATKPALEQKDFGPSKDLYKAVTSRFSLMDQFRGGLAQHEFAEFAKSVRSNRIEASRVNVSDLSSRDIYIVAPKGHKTDVVDKVVHIARHNPEFAHLLSAPDLSEVWRKAQTPEDSIVGGFDMKDKFMFFLARPPLEGAKALFAIPENPGRLKPRPERDPAFISHGNRGVAIVQYPEQIEKAHQYLKYFLRAASDGVRREAACLVMGNVIKTDNIADDARVKIYQVAKSGGIDVVYSEESSISAAKALVNELILKP